MWVKTVIAFTIVYVLVLAHGELLKNSYLNLKIVGGQEVVPHTHPYQVGIAIREPKHRTGWCGGALITDMFVLTAVHCLKGIQLATLYIGAHDIRNLSNTMTIDVTPRNMLLHRLWTPRYAVNDIALIRLPKSITFSDSIQPIVLPNNPQTIHNVSPGQMLVAIGWGRTSSNTSIARPSKLHSIQLRVEADATCKNLFFHYDATLNICLEGNVEKTTCFGDSGGPIVVINERTGTHVLVGITSYGRKCENVSVLTKVAAYLDWIELTMRTGEM
ncbi:cathepsin G-like [Eupeodes corollae]|uniref:cathepsin G-like n=1 Tax=Eupeodes corollae TaxID=290404 RepID=UPI00249392F4|nr:cathepsin G-like [Eupeodes corollae]